LGIASFPLQPPTSNGVLVLMLGERVPVLGIALAVMFLVAECVALYAYIAHLR
jgi:hypothetical protein